MLLIVIFVLLLVISYVLCKKDVGGNFSCYTFVISLGVVIICGCLLIPVQAKKQENYEKTVMERDMLEYRIKNYDDNLTGNELLYSDILSYNQKVYVNKKWSQNLWVNWFWNEKIAELDYIDIDKENAE